MDNPDLGTLVLRKLGTTPAPSVATSPASPRIEVPADAVRHYDAARELGSKNKVKDARKELEEAVKIAPNYSSAWFALGGIDQQEKKTKEAREAYLKAISASPNFVPAYLQLAALSAAEQKWSDALAKANQAIAIEPGNAEALYYAAVAEYNLDQFPGSYQNAQKARTLDPQHRVPKIELVLAQLEVLRSNFTGAADHLRTYLQIAPNAPDTDKVKADLAKLQQMSKK
jgi:tetratricopeptide (TPR) repeat protein